MNEERTTSRPYLWSFVTQIFYNGLPNHGGFICVPDNEVQM